MTSAPRDQPSRASRGSGQQGIPGGPRGWVSKFRSAVRGVGLAWAEGSSYVVHAVSAALAVGLAAYLQLGPIQWALVVIAITLVLVAELLNSALERVSRAVTSEWHPVIRDALDVSSGAVLVAATGAAVLAALIFLPPLLAAL